MKIKHFLFIAILFCFINKTNAEGGLLLQSQHTARDFGNMKTTSVVKKQSGSRLKDLGFGFVLATTISYNQFKNSAWFRPAEENGNPYECEFATASSWLHLELVTPIINITYEGDLSLWSSYPSSPHYSKTEINFHSIVPLSGEHESSMVLAMLLPKITHTIMSTREYTKNVWDVSALYLLEWKKNTETFLEPENVYRKISNRYYYFSMTNYILWMADFSRFMHVYSVMKNQSWTENLSLTKYTPFPFCNIYYETLSTEKQQGGIWQEIGAKTKEPFNIEAGLMYSHDFLIGNRCMIHPHFIWVCWPYTNIEAYLSFQYVF